MSCPNKMQPGGCHLHNLQCGYPACDQSAPAAAVKQSLTAGEVQGDACGSIAAFLKERDEALCDGEANDAERVESARLIAALASRQPGRQVPVPFAVESPAFEVYAKSAGLDMHQHPLHYLFLNPETHAARQAWKAALQFAPPSQGIDLGPQQDAERYRWLRDHYDPSVHDDEDGSFLRLSGEELDAAIDDELTAGTGLGSIQPPRDLRTKLGEV